MDLIYENSFDSDLVEMTHYIGIMGKLKRSCIYYIDQLLKRYGKNESNSGDSAKPDNNPLCRLIDESDVIGGFVQTLMSDISFDDSIKSKIYGELQELVKIDFKTDNITALINLWMLFTLPAPWCNWGNRNYRSDKEESDNVLQLIKQLIGCQPVYHLFSVNHVFSFFSEKKSYEEMKDIIKLFGGAISIDNIKDRLYSETEIKNSVYYICSRHILKPILENDLIIMTDPIEENQYIDHLIKNKSRFFDQLIEKLSPSKKDIETLIPVCIEHGNYTALNYLRKQLQHTFLKGK